MNIRQLLTTAFFICLANGVAQQAMAASQGSLGGSSSGTTTVSLVKGFGLKISDIDDVDFGPTTTQPADAYEDVCVYSSNGTYRITATSANGSAAKFRMLGQTAFNYLEYDIEWTADTSATSGANLNNATQSADMAGANSVLEDCNGIPTARIIFDVNNGSFNNAATDTYSDTLTLTIEPI